MTKPEFKSALILTLACLALAGCAMFDWMGLPPRALPVNCRAGDCTVVVTVTGCASHEIHLDREPLVVDPHYKGPIHWDLVAPGYSFSANGIDIKQGTPPEFDGKSHMPKKFKWNNKHTTRDRYKYDVNVVPDGQLGKVCSKDPTIMN